MSIHLPLVEYDDKRLIKWDTKSLNLISVDGKFPGIVRGLGRLDCYLRIQDELIIQTFGKKDLYPNLSALEDFLTLSQLWVFGAYEFLRSLQQYLEAKKDLVDENKFEAVRDMKIKFERIRIPLAKLEPAKRFSNSDDVPKGALVLSNARDKGWCWKLNEEQYVWRKELGEDLLCFLDLFPTPKEYLDASNKNTN